MDFWNDAYESELSKITVYLDKYTTSKTLEDGTIIEVYENPIDEYVIRAWNSFKDLFENNRENLNKFTPFNQHYLDVSAKPTLNLLKVDKYKFLYFLLRVIYEYYFINPNNDDYSDIWGTDIITNINSIEEAKKKYNYTWIERSMPVSILRFLMNSSEFTSIIGISRNINKYKEDISKHTNDTLNNYEEESKKITTEINKLIQDTKATTKDLDDYQKKLDKYKSEYNFVLLSKAFNNLHDKKSLELKKTKILIWLFTILLVLPPAFSFVNHIRNWFPTGEGITLLSFYLPLLTFEILIFYFMRLYYSESRILNTQLLQIDHRLSICEFIYDYFEKKNKSDDKDNKESWALFESLIFSPIQMTSDNIPSVLDGANAVAELAGKVMSKAKD